MPQTPLLIGEVAALTGISAGRIRHYEQIGLLALEHSANGYRTFHATQLLVLLHIDLLRSLGLGIAEIRHCLAGEAGGVQEALEKHRGTLVAERDRLDALVAAFDAALDQTADEQDLVNRLAASQRDSFGAFGRLTRPLSPAAAKALRDVGRWELPVSPLFGQMVLPESVTELLERLAAAEGHQALFERLHELAQDVVALPPEDRAAGSALAVSWVEEQLRSDPAPAVAAVLRAVVPGMAHLPVYRQGFPAWADTLSPAAGQFLREVQRLAQVHGAPVLGVIVVRP